MDALSQLTEPLPDVIISDLRMPRMSGVELLAVVRQRFPHVPVIAMSAEFLRGESPAGVLADAFLPKGNFAADQLCATIAELISASPLRSRPSTVA